MPEASEQKSEIPSERGTEKTRPVWMIIAVLVTVVGLIKHCGPLTTAKTEGYRFCNPDWQNEEVYTEPFDVRSQPECRTRITMDWGWFEKGCGNIDRPGIWYRSGSTKWREVFLRKDSPRLPYSDAIYDIRGTATWRCE